MPDQTALTASALAALYNHGVETIAGSRAHATRMINQALETGALNQGDRAATRMQIAYTLNEKQKQLYAHLEAANNLVKTIQVTHQQTDLEASQDAGKVASSLGGISASINA